MQKTIYTAAHGHLIALLREERSRLGLTQAELGDRVGKGQRFISMIEKGQRRVDVVEFISIARALRVSPTKLLGTVLSRMMASDR